MKLHLLIQSVPITYTIVSLNPILGKVCLIQYLVIKFFPWLAICFFLIFQFPLLIKLIIKI